jgi:hypothetical protein
MGVFYYIVKNLPASSKSCYANVHLLASCYSAYLKTYGSDPNLDKFVAEIKYLSTVGFSGDFPLLGKRQSLLVCVRLHVTIQLLFGYTESFSADYLCTLCISTQEEIQHKFYEHLFETRTVSQYQKCVNNIPVANAQGKVRSAPDLG